MSAIITKDYRILNADTFIRSMAGGTPLNYLYLFIGKSTSWVNDTLPPSAIDNMDNTNEIWNNILSLKRILSSDVSLGVMKKNWVYGNFYDIYRHDYGNAGANGVTLTGSISTPATLGDANYYVVSDVGSVYMCIDNNGGTASTDNPVNYGTGIGFDIFTTGDGYRWKYIASTSPSDYSKFSSIEFHPIKNVLTEPPIGDPYENQYLSQVKASTMGGAIFNIITENSGTSIYYSTTIGTLGEAGQSQIVVKGDGTGLQLQFSTNSSGGVSKVTVLDPGQGYTYCYVNCTAITSASFTPIITPLEGLGADIVRDMNAYYMLMDIKLAYAEGDGIFTTSNDYRQIGIVSNPKDYNGTLAAQNALDATYNLVMTTANSYTVDGIITNTITGTTARVVDWDPISKILRVNFPRPSSSVDWVNNLGFAAGHPIHESDWLSGVTATIESVIPPDVMYNSGKIIYYENRKPITRDASQIEDIHIALEF
jgi:hypothetical protein